jgi:flagellar export protein FliJ
MPFRFPLEAILHFRNSVEHQQELRLRAANQQVARIRHLSEQLERRVHDNEKQRSGQLGAGVTAAELQFSLLCESVLQQQIQELRRELVRVQALRDQQQRIYRQARREREILENLRERQLRAYQLESARRAQKEVDDLFLLRQAYRRQSNLRRG